MATRNIPYGYIALALVAAGSTTLTYTYFSERFIDNVCPRVIEKYGKLAIENGFVDYEIS